MLLSASSRIQARPQVSRKPQQNTRACKVVCQSHATRRDVLNAGLIATVASPLILVKPAAAEGGRAKVLPVESLSAFQRGDQRKEFTARANAVLKQYLTAADAPTAVRLALHDAGTYDIVTKTGGFDGSIATNTEELNRPENASVKALVKKLAEAKAQIDAEDKTGAGPISWADTIYLAGRATTILSWSEIKVGRAQTPSGGQIIATAFPNPWPAEIGRIDSSEAGPNRVPAPDADVETIRNFLLQLAAKPGAGSGPFTPKPPFWERPGFILWTASAADPEAEEARFVAAYPDVYTSIKKSFDISRRTVTRTDYEVDFAAIYNKACSLGAKFKPDAYLYPQPL